MVNSRVHWKPALHKVGHYHCYMFGRRCVLQMHLAGRIRSLHLVGQTIRLPPSWDQTLFIGGQSGTEPPARGVRLNLARRVNVKVHKHIHKGGGKGNVGTCIEVSIFRRVRIGKAHHFGSRNKSTQYILPGMTQDPPSLPGGNQR